MKVVHYRSKKDKQDAAQKEVIDNVIQLQKEKYDQLIRKYEEDSRQSKKGMKEEMDQLKYLLRLRD